MSPGWSRPELGFELASATTSVGVARRRIDRWLSAQGAAAELRDRVAVVVSELVTNAVEASADGFAVRADQPDAPGGVRLRVTNRAEPGAIPPRADWGADSLMAERGRGLAIVAHLCESVSVEHFGGRVVVTAVLGDRGA